MATSHDDLGRTVHVPAVTRVVSLVPSLTEAIAVSAPGLLVGATQWCTHPRDLDVVRVRGTKNPDVARIVELAPDLVVANREENRRIDVDRLVSAGLAVWVTNPETVPEALDSLGRLLVQGCQLDSEPGWLRRARQVWGRAVPPERLAVAVPIWRDPWMVVGPRTFTSDVLRRLGAVNVFADAPSRYPHTTPPEILARHPAVVLLPDEPYAFSDTDGPDSFPGARCVCVSGRLLTWYGPSLVDAVHLLDGID